MNQLVFDYRLAAKNYRISDKVLRNLEEEIRLEFPNDDMLMELHILRALKAHTCKSSQTVN